MSSPGPAWAAAVGEVPGVQVHAGEGAADDLRAIGRIAAEGGGRPRRRLRRRRDPARGARRPAGRAAHRDRDHLDGRPRGPALRLQDARAARAHHLRRLALPRRAQPDRHVPRRGQGLARRPRRRPARSPSGWPRSSRPGRRPTGRRSWPSSRSTGTGCSRCPRWTGERGEPAPAARGSSTRSRCRRRTPPSSSAGARWRPTTSPRCCSSASSARACTSSASHLRSLFWARPLSPAALERAAADILEHDEDRELLNSAVKGSDGFFTTFFVSTYSKYIARWAASRGHDAEPGHDHLRRRRRAGRRRLRDRRAPRDGGGRAAPVLRLRARLRRRPARPLHAPVLQARRLARLDLRPHEGVRRVRRACDRREPDRRSRCGCWRAPRWRCRPPATGSTSPIPPRSTR